MGRRRNKISDEPFEADIISLDSKAMGITLHNEKRLRVFDALPGKRCWLATCLAEVDVVWQKRLMCYNHQLIALSHVVRISVTAGHAACSICPWTRS